MGRPPKVQEQMEKETPIKVETMVDKIKALDEQDFGDVKHKVVTNTRMVFSISFASNLPENQQKAKDLIGGIVDELNTHSENFGVAVQFLP